MDLRPGVLPFEIFARAVLFDFASLSGALTGTANHSGTPFGD
jgi:hypothetical protein